MRILIITLVTTLVAFSGMPSRAEVVEYDIEIVFFEDTTNRYSNSERWPKIEHELLPDNKTAIKFGDTPDAGQSDEGQVVSAIENETNSLEKYITRLEKSTHYNVLTHKAWRQTGLDAESAIEVYIDSIENKATPNENTGITNAVVDSNIKGTVKIVLGRYLHIYTDMIYQKPDSSYTPVNNKKYKEYLIKSHRRMRSNELHYIDHPLVGILVMAQPVALPEIEVEETKIEQEPIINN